MGLKVYKPSRKRSSYFFNTSYPYRDTLIVQGGRSSRFLFLNSAFGNPFRNYQAVSLPVASGTYKVRVASEDNLGNINSPGADPEASSSVVVNAFTLPPRDVEFVVSGNDVLFTWRHSADGAPDNYKFYGVQDGNVIDRVTPLDTIGGTLTSHTLTLASGVWKVVLEAVISGVESVSLFILDITTPDTAVIPPRPGLPATNEPSGDIDDSNPFVETGLELSNVSIGKVKIRFYWLWGVLASSFNVFHNGGSGDIDFDAAAAFNFTRIAGLIQEFTTTQLHSTDVDLTFKFAARAVSPDGVEDDNTDIYEIDVDGVAPDLIEDIALSTRQ